jgi:hypothetical protein
VCPIHRFVNEWIVELSLRCGDLGGECKEGDLCSYGRTSITRPDRGCLLFLWLWAPLAQRHIKGARRGHKNQCSLCPHSAPQTLDVRPIIEGVEARARPHCSATVVALLHRHHYYDHRRRHVFLIIGPR